MLQLLQVLVHYERLGRSRRTFTDVGRRRRKRPSAEMRPMPEPRNDLVAEGPQEALQVQGLRLLQVQPHRREAEGHGCPGKMFKLTESLFFYILSS